MKYSWNRYFSILSVAILYALMVPTSWATKLTDIKVRNGLSETKVTLNFDGRPIYGFFPLSGPERVVLDVQHSGNISGLPLEFSGQNLLKRIRSSQPKDPQSTRLVFELMRKAKTRAVTQQSGRMYSVIFTLTAENNGSLPQTSASLTEKRNPTSKVSNTPFNNNQPATAVAYRPSSANMPARQVKAPRLSANEQVIVAIDAGHGGQDPGAIGQNGLKEKNVTISIARKLGALLNDDPLFKPVLTRNGDYFISVMGRSDVARKHGANLLVSIHADAAPNRSATGASVWVLSNRRANSEMGNWLEQHEKQSELLGGAGNLLANTSADPYLSQAVLDLQFCHSQRVGYDAAVSVLQELRGISSIHKRRPEHASLGVLRSPDIPSLLVETGFISNSTEEQLLGSDAHQNKVAQAIHKGLRSYFLAYPLQTDPKSEGRASKATTIVKSAALRGKISQPERPAVTRNAITETAVITKIQIHTVGRGETLSAIANRYGVNMTVLRSHNNLKKDVVWIGQRLQIPVIGSTLIKTTVTKNNVKKPIKHQVKRGDTLSAIAVRYGVSPREIQRANNIKSETVQIGQTLTIPLS